MTALPEWCLTIRQPFATLLVEGPCRIINRTKAPPRHLLGKRVAIYAAGIPDTETAARAMQLLEAAGVPQASRLMWTTRAVRGAVIGSAVLAGVVTESADPWFVGPFGLWFTGAERLETPVVLKGRDGFWRINR